MRLLLIEDDDMLSRAVCQALEQSGYAVDIAATARAAARLARAEVYSAGILDLGLPDRDGLELLHDLRRDGVPFPILILSARGALNDRIRGLDTGADDYLVKPFALGELEARLRALLRRAEEKTGWRQLGALRFDGPGKRALARDEELELTARELAILEVLMAHARRIVSKQALFDAVFSHETDAAPNALEVHVSRLRHKLKAAGVTIRGVRGLGYRIEENAEDGGGKP
jgi:DNA-binding response OmpR family regulator